MMNVLVTVLIVVTSTFTLVKSQDTPGGNFLRVENPALSESSASSINANSTNIKSHNEGAGKWYETSNIQFSYLHAIEEVLLLQSWEEREQPCLRQLIKIIKNVQNSTLWATWIWDSMQSPSGQLYGSLNHLGNYDQCLSLPWKDHPEFRTQYCLAEIKLSELDPGINDVDLLGPAQKYIRLSTKQGLFYNTMSWGICAPAICNAESVVKFTHTIFKFTHLGEMKTPYSININTTLCDVAGEVREKMLIEYIFLLLCIVFTVTTLLCTWYVGYKGATSTSTSNFAKAFDIKANTQRLWKTGDKSLRSVLGIRLISTFFIISGHVWFIKTTFGSVNAGQINKQWEESKQAIMFNMDLIVDTFFMISGLLLVKSILESNVKTFNPLVVIARRYIRLIILLLLIIMILPIVLLYGESGPLVKKINYIEVDYWAASSWKSVLMIGNYGDTSKINYVVLWSLAVDFHLTVVGILICWIYLKHKRAGIFVYAVCAMAALIIPVMYGYTHNSNAVITFDFRFTSNHRKLIVGDPAYVGTHLRAGPYFVGLAFGYLMAHFRLDKYRNVMSKKSSLFAFFTFLIMFASINYISGIYHWREYSPLEGALISVMRRNVFAAIVGFFILISEYGSLPIINRAFSWSGLVPLSKLSYGVYLTHLMFILRFVSRTRVQLRSDAGQDMMSTVGLLAFTNTLCLLMWLFWEAPLMNLSDMVFKRLVCKDQLNQNEKLIEASAENETYTRSNGGKKLN